MAYIFTLDMCLSSKKPVPKFNFDKLKKIYDFEISMLAFEPLFLLIILFLPKFFVKTPQKNETPRT